MSRWIARSLLLVAGVVYLLTTAVSAVEAWVVAHPTEQNLPRLLRWSGADSLAWRLRARSKLLSFDRAELEEGAASYRQALARNPLDPLAWDGLASVYRRLGNSELEEATLRGALVAVPNSPSFAWRLGNFLLLQQRNKEAYPLLRAAAGHDANLRAPLFALAWKLLGDPQRILADLVPSDPDSRRDYFYFLAWTRNDLPAALPVWEEVTRAPTEERKRDVLTIGSVFVNSLAEVGLGPEARRVWDDLLRLSGAFASEGDTQEQPDLITNGDFEAALRDGGLDWRLFPEAGFQIAPDSFAAQHGARSLRVTFDGTTNPDFAAVRQWVPVEPGRRYRLVGFLRTENISTDNGLYLSVATQGAPPEESWERTTENRVGTNPWTREQVDFQTGPHTRIVQVVLRRRRSAKLNNLLVGKVWIDNLSLTPLAE